MSAASEEMGPFGDGAPKEFTFLDPPLATDDVTLTFRASADLGSTSEYVVIELNGTEIGLVFQLGASDCGLKPSAAAAASSAAATKPSATSSLACVLIPAAARFCHAGCQ